MWITQTEGESCDSSTAAAIMMITETATSVVLPNGGGKIRRLSFKSRTSATQINGGGSMRGYRAVRVTVPSTVVAELASKFNAVVVDADRGDTTREIIKKVNKSLAKGVGVRATVEKFESTVEKKHTGGNHMVVVRTNSDHRMAAVVPEQRSSSIVKRRMEQFQNGKKPIKPSFLGPKPNVANLRREERRLIQKNTTPAVAGDRHLLNKHKRLSIAKDPDAQFESVLNVTSPTMWPQEPQQPMETEQRAPSSSPPPKIQPKPNSSFLHGRKRPTMDDGNDDHGGGLRTNAKEESLSSLAGENDDKRPASFLHTYKKNVAKDHRHNIHDYNYIVGAEQPQAIYEELCDIQKSVEMHPDLSLLPDVVLESTYYDGTNDHHYTTIECAEQNIYDDVVTAATAAQENRKRPASEDGSYETVQPPPPPLPPAVSLQVVPVTVSPPLLPVDDDDNCGVGRLEKKQLSDSSLEIDNSIYGLNPPSESTSSGMTTSL